MLSDGEENWSTAWQSGPRSRAAKAAVRDSCLPFSAREAAEKVEKADSSWAEAHSE